MVAGAAMAAPKVATAPFALGTAGFQLETSEFDHDPLPGRFQTELTGPVLMTLMTPAVVSSEVFQPRPAVRLGRLSVAKVPLVLAESNKSKVWPSSGMKPFSRLTSRLPPSVKAPLTVKQSYAVFRTSPPRSRARCDVGCNVTFPVMVMPPAAAGSPGAMVPVLVRLPTRRPLPRTLPVLAMLTLPGTVMVPAVIVPLDCRANSARPVPLPTVRLLTVVGSSGPVTVSAPAGSMTTSWTEAGRMPMVQLLRVAQVPPAALRKCSFGVKSRTLVLPLASTAE